MKLKCAKCDRPVSVRERDVREVAADVSPRCSSDSFMYGRSLACPFCLIERGINCQLSVPEQRGAA